MKTHTEIAKLYEAEAERMLRERNYALRQWYLRNAARHRAMAKMEEVQAQQ